MKHKTGAVQALPMPLLKDLAEAPWPRDWLLGFSETQSHCLTVTHGKDMQRLATLGRPKRLEL